MFLRQATDTARRFRCIVLRWVAFLWAIGYDQTEGSVNDAQSEGISVLTGHHARSGTFYIVNQYMYLYDVNIQILLKNNGQLTTNNQQPK